MSSCLARFRFPEERRVAPHLNRSSASRHEPRTMSWPRMSRALSARRGVADHPARAIGSPHRTENILGALRPPGVRRHDRRSSPAPRALRVRRDELSMRRHRAESTTRPSGRALVGRTMRWPLVLAADPRCAGIAVVRVPPPASNVAWQLPSTAALSVPRYVVAAEGSRGGINAASDLRRPRRSLRRGAVGRAP